MPVLLVMFPPAFLLVTTGNVSILVQGASDTKEYRQFVQHEGKDVSAWHDIPLQNEDGTFNFVCEIPKETSAKMEVATVRSHTYHVCW